MNKVILGAAALGALIATPAVAADMPVKALPPPVVNNWTNCYLGINGGYKWGQFRESADAAGGVATIPGNPLTTFAPDHIDLPHLDTGSGVVGGQIGCRWENPQHWVFGFEGDIDFQDLHGTVTNRRLGTGGDIFVPGDSFDNRSRWQSSARIIVGKSWGQWLLYGTGGLAGTDVRMGANFIPVVSGGIPFPGSSGFDTQVLIGGTIGAGVAYALSRNWDVGLEYRFSAYAAGSFGLGQVAAFCGFTTAIAAVAPTCVNTNVSGHKDLDTQEVLFKLNYRY
jgi:outer membrane immunogenic protein